MLTQEVNLTWASDVFLNAYNSIKTQRIVSPANRQALKNDLRNILVVPARNEKSRSKLAASETGKPVEFHNGQDFTLNNVFISAASSLASELNLDELLAAELLQETSSTSFAHSSSAVDAGILGFYQRYSYILNILGFIIAEKQLDTIYPGSANEVLPQILKSFQQIYSLVSLQNDLIDKQNATADVSNLQFVNKTAYAKEQLFELHDLLAQILYSLIDKHIDELGSYDTYKSIINHINENIKDNGDILIMHYFPALMRIFTCLLELRDEKVHQFHQLLVSSLSEDYSKVSLGDEIDTSKSCLRPHELLLQLIFYISFVPWCKEMITRTQKFDFEKDVLKYVEWLINYGTMEQLLCYSAESADDATKATFDRKKLFDFRPLLQKTFPGLTPSLFVYSRNEELIHVAKTRPELSNVLKLCDYLSFSLSAHMREALLAPLFHSFFCNFVNHSAIVLTSLRDSEEDFLLSSINRKQLEFDKMVHPSGNTRAPNHGINQREKFPDSIDTKSDYGIDLDEIATRAELERFYLAFAYTYNNRADICQAFWSHDDSNVVGFVSWGLANNTSPLITATFCLLLGSLTFGGQSSDKVWEILLNSGLSRKKDYSQISIDSIISSLTYYVDALEGNVVQDLKQQGKYYMEKHDSFFVGANSVDEPNGLPIQLSEDSVVFIAGFIMLLSMVVQNLSTVSMKKAAFLHFLPIISSFLRLDNLVTSANISQSRENAPVISFNDENRTAIINLILHFLTTFADQADLELRCKIWIVVDKWISHSIDENDTISSTTTEDGRASSMALIPTSFSRSEPQKMRAFNRNVSMNRGFQTNLTTVSEVLNFVCLIEVLLKSGIKCHEADEMWAIPFPSDLGQTHRPKKHIGVWPYFEYLITEVFAKSANLKEDDVKQDLQNLVLSIIVSALSSTNWDLIDESTNKILPDFAQFEDRFAYAFLSSGEQTVLSLQNFSRLHHSFAIINYMFDTSASEALFDIINKGAGELSQRESSEKTITLALLALLLILKSQKSFLNKLLILRNFDGVEPRKGTTAGYGTSMSLMLSSPQLEYNNMYYPDNIGTKGVRDYYEMLLYHIFSIAHVALYVGSSSDILADLSLKILRLISQSPVFVPSAKDTLLQQNRLLSIFQSIDESEKIKFGFLQQMESTTQSLKPKYDILRYLIENLPASNETTVAHFLLGFEIKADKLHFLLSKSTGSLLHELLDLLLDSLPLIAMTNYGHGYHNQIQHGPVLLCSLIMDVLVRLSGNVNSSKITLDFLRQHDLFEKLVSTQPTVDDMTVWQTYRFDGDMLDGAGNEFVENDKCRDTIFEFVSFRNLVLQYLSFELHNVGPRSVKEHYIGILLDGTEFLDGTARILNFLDVLNYRFHNIWDYNLLPFEKHFNLDRLAHEFEHNAKEHSSVSLLDDLTTLRCRIANNVLPDRDTKLEFKMDASTEATRLNLTLKKAFFVQKMKTLNSKTLHAWVQIVQVLTSEEASRNANFIPQVLLVILPKINNDYYEQDMPFAEELVALCLYLFDLLADGSCDAKESKASEKTSLQGFFAVLKTCVNGLMCTKATTSLRSDLYLLINKFIQKGLEHEDMLSEVMHVLKAADSKFIDVICNDSIYSEGVSRISSLVLLESLIHLFGQEPSSSIVAMLNKNNFLSLLVQSLKRADEIIGACGELLRTSRRDPGVNLETFFYELTALKTTVCVLIRLAQTRSGAMLLAQNDIFSTLRKLKFLSVDAELGLTFCVLEDAMGGNDASIKLALDVPLTLREREQKGQEKRKTFSLYEILTPIFQLISTLLLSLGPSYKPGMSQVEDLMKCSHSIVLGVLKRDSLFESHPISPESDESEAEIRDGLKKLVDLVTLISTVLSSTRNA